MKPVRSAILQAKSLTVDPANRALYAAHHSLDLVLMQLRGLLLGTLAFVRLVTIAHLESLLRRPAPLSSTPQRPAVSIASACLARLDHTVLAAQTLIIATLGTIVMKSPACQTQTEPMIWEASAQ